MVSIFSLWLPILLSAVLAFIASSIIHMALKYHRNDFVKLPDEDGVMDALSKHAIPPGDYMLPCGDGPGAMKDPAYMAKVERGPVATMTVMSSKVFNMGPTLVMWFIYLLVVGVFAAYVAGRTLSPGADYLSVFRLVGATVFMAHALAHWQGSIWYKRKWSTTIKNSFDALVYALLAAGCFAGFWPGGIGG